MVARIHSETRLNARVTGGWINFIEPRPSRKCAIILTTALSAFPLAGCAPAVMATATTQRSINVTPSRPHAEARANPRAPSDCKPQLALGDTWMDVDAQQKADCSQLTAARRRRSEEHT